MKRVIAEKKSKNFHLKKGKQTLECQLIPILNVVSSANFVVTRTLKLL